MTEAEPDLDEGGWLETSPRTPKKLSWRTDPQESHSDWKVEIRSGDGDEENTVYHLHKVVLSNGPRASGYFHAQFSLTTIETKTATTILEIPRQCSQCVPKLLDFFYEGTLELDSDTAVPMMELARRLDIPALGIECMDCIKTKLKESDAQFAFQAFVQAHELHMDKVFAAAMKVVSKMFSSINADSLVCLPIDRLVQLLQQDELRTNEDKVFDLIVAFIEVRKLSEADAQELWTCCRFAHLSSEKKIAAMQQATFPRALFFEDAVAACIAAHDDGDSVERSCFSPECNERIKKRKRTISVLTEDSKLSVQGNSLTTTDGICFQVLPTSSPTAPQTPQHKNPFQLPQGWEIVKMADTDFDMIRSVVIAQYCWGTHVIHVQDGQQFAAFSCKGYSTPGGKYEGPFLESLDGSNFRFTIGSGRLLIRKKP